MTEQNKKFKRWVLFGVLAGFVLFLAVFQLPMSGSWEAEVADEFGFKSVKSLPRTADGVINFSAIYNSQHEYLGDFDKNIAVDILIACGTHSSDRQAVKRALGYPQLLNEPLLYFSEFRPADQRDDDSFEPRQNTFCEIDFDSQKDRQYRSQYVQKFRANLDWLMEATHKEFFFCPAVNLSNGSNGLHYFDYLASSSKRAANGLKIYGIYHLERSELDSSIENFLAINRLVELLSHSQTASHLRAALYAQNEAIDLLQTMILHFRLNRIQRKKIKESIESTPIINFFETYRTTKLHKAFWLLEMVVNRRKGLYLYDKAPLLSSLIGVTDKKLAAKTLALEFQRISRQLKESQDCSSIAVLKNLEKRMVELDRNALDGYTRALSGAKSRGRLLSDNLLFFILAHEHVRDEKNRIDGAVRRDLTLLFLAVDEYRESNGKLVGDLKQLVPNYLNAIPDDRYTGIPLQLRKIENGLIVFSPGENRQVEFNAGPLGEVVNSGDDLLLTIPFTND